MPDNDQTQSGWGPIIPDHKWHVMDVPNFRVPYAADGRFEVGIDPIADRLTHNMLQM